MVVNDGMISRCNVFLLPTSSAFIPYQQKVLITADVFTHTGKRPVKTTRRDVKMQDLKQRNTGNKRDTLPAAQPTAVNGSISPKIPDVFEQVSIFPIEQL